MHVTSAAAFIALVEKSGVLTAEQLAEARATVGTESDPKVAAKLLIQKGLLTRWQASQILLARTRLIIGKYRLVEQLGRGGMGNVYLAEHVQMRRRVALKTLTKAVARDGSAIARLVAEAQAVAALDHKNIIRAYDLEADEALSYLVMEYVEGDDLQRMVEQHGPLEFVRAADYIAQAADGLEHAHNRDMIHRDIKPGNLLVDRNGTVKILDLGLAQMIDRDEAALANRPEEQVLGTIDYLAPEQALSSRAADERSDIYSLGCTFYFLLAGRPPFAQGTLAERLVKHQTQEPPSLVSLRADTPPELAMICRRMMAKKPKDRYQSVDEVGAALRLWLETRLQALRRSNQPAELGLRPETSTDSGIANKSSIPKPKEPAPVIAAQKRTTLVEELDSLIDTQKVPRMTDTLPGRSGPMLAVQRKQEESNQLLILGAVAAGIIAVIVVGILAFMSLNGRPDTSTETPVVRSKETTGPSAPDAAPARTRRNNTANEPPAPTVSAPVAPKQSDAPAAEVSTTSTEPSAPKPEEKPVPKKKPRKPKPPDATATPLSTATAISAPAPKPELPNPFRDLPAAVDLPHFEESTAVNKGTQRTALGKLQLEKDQKLSATLAAADAAVPGKGAFRVASKPGSTDFQVDLISGFEDPVPVADFKLENDNFTFQWLSGVTKSATDQLRNTAILLSAGERKHTLALRTAQVGEPLTVSLDRKTTGISISVEFLPEPETLALEVTGLECDGVSFEIQNPAQIPLTGQPPKEPPTVLIGETDKKPLALRISAAAKGRGMPRLEVAPFLQSNNEWFPFQLRQVKTVEQNVTANIKKLDEQIAALRTDRQKNRKQISEAEKQRRELRTSRKDLQLLTELYDKVNKKAKLHYRLVAKDGEVGIELVNTGFKPLPPAAENSDQPTAEKPSEIAEQKTSNSGEAGPESK